LPPVDVLVCCLLQIDQIFFWRIFFFFPLLYSDLGIGSALLVTERLVAGFNDV